MADTYTLISSVTVGAGGASSIDFTSIPATYTDLLLDISARSDRASTQDWTKIEFNGSTTSYTMRILAGDGTNAASGTDTTIYLPCAGNNATASTFGNSYFYIPNYAGSNNKSVSGDGTGENNGTTTSQYLIAGLWSNTAAITSIKLSMQTAGKLFMQYSTAYLYGIKNS